MDHDIPDVAQELVVQEHVGGEDVGKQDGGGHQVHQDVVPAIQLVAHLKYFLCGKNNSRK